MDATLVQIQERDEWMEIGSNGATAQAVTSWSPSAMSLLPDHRQRTVWCGDALVCSENAGTQPVWLVVACPPWPTSAEPRFGGAASSAVGQGLEPHMPHLSIQLILPPRHVRVASIAPRSFFLISLQFLDGARPERQQTPSCMLLHPATCKTNDDLL